MKNIEMSLKEREDCFIETCKRNMGDLTFETELLLRFGYSSGAGVYRIAYADGRRAQREHVLEALGAVAQKACGKL